MYTLNHLIVSIAHILDILLTLYSYIVIAAAILSYVFPYPYHPIVRFIYRVTEPLLTPIRKIIPWRLPIDISPLILLLAIHLVQRFLISSLIDLGYSLKGGIP